MKIQYILFKDAVRVGNNIESSCDSTRFQISIDLATRLVKVKTEKFPLSSTVVPLDNVKYIVVDETSNREVAKGSDTPRAKA